MADNEVKVKLTADEKQAVKALDKLEKKVKKTGKEAEESIGKADIAFGAFVGNLAAEAASKAIGKLTGVFNAAFDEMLKFNVAIAEINTLLPETERLSEDIVKSIKALSAEFGTVPKAQAKAFYQIISAGSASGAEAVDLLREANKLAQGGLAEIGGSVNILTDILNVYGQENITAAEAADALFTTVKLGKTNISQLSASMGLALPSAKQLGISVDVLGAALATMTTQGLSTSQRVTQLNGLFTALFSKSADAGKTFGKKVGDAFNLTAIRTKGLNKFLSDLIVATEGSEEVLTKLLGSAEAVRAVFALTGDQTATFTKNIEEFTNKAGAANDAAAVMRDTLDFQLRKAGQNIKNLASDILNLLTPALRGAVKAFNATFEASESSQRSLQDWQKELERLKKLQEEGVRVDRLRGGSVQNNIKITENRIAQLQKEIDLEEKKNDVKTKSVGGTGGGKSLTEAEKAAIVELQALKDLAEIQDLERAERVRVAEGTAREEDYAALAAFEQEKIEIKKRAALASETDTRKRAVIEAKFNAQQREAETKALVDDAKRRKRIREISFRTANAALGNFLQVGLMLTKQGSAEYKAIATLDATRQTFVAANNALATPAPWPLPQIFAASAIALGLANVAKIQSFAGGGVVGGFQGATSGPDNTIANVRTGEMMLNGQQQKSLFTDISEGGGTAEEIRALRTAIENQPVILEIEGREVARAVKNEIDAGFSLTGT